MKIFSKSSRTQRLALLALSSTTLFPAISDANTPVTITVKAGARQTFQGFGVSQNPGRGYTGDFVLPIAQRQKFHQLIWGDAKFRALKIWINFDEFSPAPGQEDIERFVDYYGQMVRDARAAGCTTVLLTPERFPTWMKQADNKTLSDEHAPAFARLLARFINLFEERTGQRIDATEIMNEPGAAGDLITDTQLVTVINLLRADLDKRTRRILIVAPSTANTNTLDRVGNNGYYVKALKADGQAWKDLDYAASHSYNDAGNEDYTALIAPKTYWQTESGQTDHLASRPGINPWVSASIASRFLSDMNHQCSMWFYYLGFNERNFTGAEANQNREEDGLVMIGFTPKTDRFEIKPQHLYLKQLAHTFDVGATFRDSQSSIITRDDPSGDMTWDYGPKPSVIASAAKNPGGTWAVGISNLTAASFSNQDPNFASSGTPPTTFDVTLQIDEAKSGTKIFKVFKSNAGASSFEKITSDAGTATMKNGSMGIRGVGSCELVTLREVRPQIKPKPQPKARPKAKAQPKTSTRAARGVKKANPTR